MLKKIDGIKTYIGVIASAILYIVIEWSESVTWETNWVVGVTAVVGAWTGMSLRSAIKKVEK
jgi:uncharacterized membrane protein YfcA